MKAYVASSLERADEVEELYAFLTNVGVEVTYRWTQHGSVQHDGVARISEVALAELEGIRKADVVVVLLPGGRGTHVELGIACALEKPVILHGDLEDQDGRPCAFYLLPNVARWMWSFHHIREIAQVVAAEDWTRWRGRDREEQKP